MSEPTDLLEVAFNDLREAVMPYAKLPGVDAARTTVRRRRRVRYGVAAVALVVVPLVAYAVFRSPNPVAAPITPATNLFPTPTAAPEPAALQALGTQSAPGWMTSGVVDVPDFGDPGCPSGQVRFINGTWRASAAATGFTPSVVIGDVVVGDVNGDGGEDLLVLFRCVARGDQARPLSQVAAYTLPPGTAGSLLGQVVRGNPVEDVSFPQVQPDKSVRVTISTNAAKLWETYRWNGQRFAQSSLPDLLPTPLPTNLNLTVTPTVAPGVLTSLAVTVHNGGTLKGDYLMVTLRSRAPMVLSGVRMTVPPPTACATPSGCQWDMAFEAVAPGQSATAQFNVLFTGSGNNTGAVDVKVVGWIRGIGDQPNADSTNAVTVPLGP